MKQKTRRLLFAATGIALSILSAITFYRIIDGTIGISMILFLILFIITSFYLLGRAISGDEK